MDGLARDIALQLRAVIETAIDGIITINDKGIIETMNPAAASLFDYKPEEVIGSNIKMLMPPEHSVQHDQYLDRYHKTKIPRIIGVGREVQGLKKNGKVFPFRLAVSEVVLNDRLIFTGIIHDLTKVHKAQEEIIALNKGLEQTVIERTYELEKVVNQLLSANSRLETEIKEKEIAEEKLKIKELELIDSLETEKQLNEMKSRFVSMASHEFRTPLTSILSSAALIGRYDTSETQEQRIKHINKIKLAVANLTGILNDFLSISKLEEGAVTISNTKVNLVELVEEVTGMSKSLFREDSKIICKIEGEQRLILSDLNILRNILFNLISNAIKYSSQDIQCHLRFDDDHVNIRIEDKGIGIPLSDQEFLFSRFFRAGNVTNIQGTGLGLNIVKRYVELLNGSINFTSIQEQGSTFIVEIPYN